MTRREFPPGFFDRDDPTPDSQFYAFARLVTHIDDGAIAAVGDLYDELGLAGSVLDLMGSWVSHFHTTPERLTVLGMNPQELAANPQAAATVVHDLNADPRVPFENDSFDARCAASPSTTSLGRSKSSPTSRASSDPARRSCTPSPMSTAFPNTSLGPDLPHRGACAHDPEVCSVVRPS
jgi:hypothetical protein